MTYKYMKKYSTSFLKINVNTSLVCHLFINIRKTLDKLFKNNKKLVKFDTASKAKENKHSHMSLAEVQNSTMKNLVTSNKITSAFSL